MNYWCWYKAISFISNLGINIIYTTDVFKVNWGKYDLNNLLSIPKIFGSHFTVQPDSLKEYRVWDSCFWIDTDLIIQRELYLDWYRLKNTERAVSGLIHT